MPGVTFKLILTVLFFAGLVISLASITPAQQNAAPKRVLVVYWGNNYVPANTVFDQNFQTALQSASAKTVEIYSEFLDFDRFPGEDQSRLLLDYLRRKYADRTIDVVIACGDRALDFLLGYRDTLFATVPIVFVAGKAPAAKELASGPGITGAFNGTTTETLWIWR